MAAPSAETLLRIDPLLDRGNIISLD